jgi:hypothetical protein
MKIGNELITWGNFNWVGLFIWILVFISLLCLGFGIKKKSEWLMVFSAFTIFPMAFYLFGAENWLRLAICVPIVEVIIAFVFWFHPSESNGIKSSM